MGACISLRFSDAEANPADLRPGRTNVIRANQLNQANQVETLMRVKGA